MSTGTLLLSLTWSGDQAASDELDRRARVVLAGLPAYECWKGPRRPAARFRTVPGWAHLGYLAPGRGEAPADRPRGGFAVSDCLQLILVTRTCRRAVQWGTGRRIHLSWSGYQPAGGVGA